MVNLEQAKRLVKRAILANITNTKPNLFITPLISGKHGIGKSQMIKSIADELNGVCITIEGGSLKEGEITGLPYQYTNKENQVKFKFLPYYAVERIQEEEKRIYIEKYSTVSKYDFLFGDENKYADNDIGLKEKLELIRSGKVRLTIIFIDEINRTENTVYKELMNILLTKSVNGYFFPWWVMFVGAMNPSTQNSLYATNEMDPAQLDRFLKIKVKEDPNQWISYGKQHNISNDILDFVSSNPKTLASSDSGLDDEEKPSPSPRGWDMVDTLLKSEPILREFFSENENSNQVVFNDFRYLVCAKLGTTVGTMFFTSDRFSVVTPEEIFNDTPKLHKTLKKLSKINYIKISQSLDLLLLYLINNIEIDILDKSAYKNKLEKIKIILNNVDSSSRIRFVQSVVDSKTISGKPLFDYLYDIFDETVLEALDLSETIRKKIESECDV